MLDSWRMTKKFPSRLVVGLNGLCWLVLVVVVIWTGGFYWLNVKTMCLGSSMIYTTKWQQKEGNVGPRS